VKGVMGNAVGRRSVKHGVQLVGQVVEHAADVIQDGHGGGRVDGLRSGKRMKGQCVCYMLHVGLQFNSFQFRCCKAIKKKIMGVK